MEENFLEFLRNGFTNVIKPLEEGGIFTLEALKCIQVDDLIKELKIGKLAAIGLLSKANAEIGTQQNTTSQNQLVELPPEAIIAINEAKNAANIRIHQLEIECLKAKFEAELKIQALQNEIKIEQLKTEIEKVRVLEKDKALEEEKRRSANISLHLSDVPLMAGSVFISQCHHEFLQRCLPSPRVWVLLYRGTRDGFSASTFHRRCNGSGPTISVIKSSSGYIFGGYNPNSWTSSGNYQKASGSFLFSLTNAWSTSPTKFSWNRDHGPCDRPRYGPTFGDGHDLHISDACNTNQCSYSHFPYSYQDTMGKGNNTFAGSKYFSVSEIEVFKLTYR
jgi:hypothetical protein